MSKAITSLLIIAALATAGCKSTGFLAKREAEKCCPTDIRKTVPWCAGEDALFQCPCQPNAAYYGYKPTCWRTWPSGGASWRDAHCGNEHHQAIITDLANQNPELIVLPQLESFPEPAPEIPPAETPTDNQPSSRPESNSTQQNSITVESAPEPPKQSRKPALEAPEEDLPMPILGPIPLPPIDEE